MTITDQLAAVQRARLATPFARTTRTITRYLAIQAAWYLGIAVVLALVALAIMMAVTEPTVSIVQFGRQSSVWFPFAVAILLVAAYLPAHVSVGMTRATFVRAALVSALVIGVLYAAAFTGAMALESVVFDAAGWEHKIVDSAWFTRDPGDLTAVAVGQFLSVVVAQCSGYLVAVVYQRVSGVWATLLLPLTAGPVLGVVVLLSEWVDDDVAGSAARWAAAVLAAAVLAVAFARLAARFAMKPAGG